MVSYIQEQRQWLFTLVTLYYTCAIYRKSILLPLWFLPTNCTTLKSLNGNDIIEPYYWCIKSICTFYLSIYLGATFYTFHLSFSPVWWSSRIVAYAYHECLSQLSCYFTLHMYMHFLEPHDFLLVLIISSQTFENCAPIFFLGELAIESQSTLKVTILSQRK